MTGFFWFCSSASPQATSATDAHGGCPGRWPIQHKVRPRLFIQTRILVIALWKGVRLHPEVGTVGDSIVMPVRYSAGNLGSLVLAFIVEMV